MLKISQKCKQPKVYDYRLPQDNQRVIAEASINGKLACVINPHYTRAEIRHYARSICKKLLASTKSVTNDFDVFTKLTVQAYAKEYLAAQKDYRAHPQNLEAAQRKLHEIGYQQAFLEMTRPVEKLQEAN